VFRNNVRKEEYRSHLESQQKQPNVGGVQEHPAFLHGGRAGPGTEQPCVRCTKSQGQHALSVQLETLKMPIKSHDRCRKTSVGAELSCFER